MLTGLQRWRARDSHGARGHKSGRAVARPAQWPPPPVDYGLLTSAAYSPTTVSLRTMVSKGKVFPYSLPSVGPGADPGVQAVSPQVT